MEVIQKKRTNKKGQALIEVMVAVGILTVGFLGIVSLLSRALALNRVVADNYTGTYLAAEGIEITKNIIDSNPMQGHQWNDGNGVSNCGEGGAGCEVDQASLDLRGYVGQPLSFNPTTNTYSYIGGAVQTNFRRRITITLVGRHRLDVRSRVTWLTSGGGTAEIVLEDTFFNWR